MAQNGHEEDDIIDDDWDNLPIETLTTLEEQAIQYTQQGHVIISPRRKKQHQHFTNVPTVPTALRQAEPRTGQNQPRNDGHAGDRTFRRDVLDPKKPTATVQTAYDDSKARDVVRRAAPQDYGQTNQSAGQNTSSFGGHQQQRGHGNVPFRGRQPESRPASSQLEVSGIPFQVLDNGSNAITNLESQIQKLLQAQEGLQNQLKEAQEEVKLKIGEIGIIRSREDKLKKDAKNELVAIQKRHEDDTAQFNAELKKAKDEKEKLITENRFLKHDLSDAVQSVKNLKGGDVQEPVRDKVNVVTISTPKKPRPKGYGDGFDDDEIMIISPAKSGGGGGRRSKGGTPTKIGGKRKKRGFQESPGKTLELSQSCGVIVEDEPQPEIGPPEEKVDQTESVAHTMGEENNRTSLVIQKINRRDGRYDILLNHRSSGDNGLRTFEEFTKYHLPSKPEVSLASTLLDQLAFLNVKGKMNENFEVEVCKILLNQWSNCLEEKYYRPIHSLNNLMTFILALNNTMSKVPEITEQLVELVQLTADINVIPRHRRSPESALKPEINVLSLLKLLHLTALGCMYHEDKTTNDPPIKVFWKRMRPEFVILLLAGNQPIEDIGVMIELLSTSSLEGSLGPIRNAGANVQREDENYVLERISALLGYAFMDAQGTCQWKAEEIARLRISVLKLLGIISCTQYGGEMLARHKRVIPQLVKTLDDELDSLYDYHERHSLSAKQINLSTRILYHLVTTHSAEINDIQEKLTLLPGGTHKHIVCLTRLAFIGENIKGMVFEKEIDEEVVQMAREMLEESVTPEEAEMLVGAFTLRGVGRNST